jgi:hypothetical protein
MSKPIYLLLLFFGLVTPTTYANDNTCWCNTSGGWSGNQASCCAIATTCVPHKTYVNGCSGAIGTPPEQYYYCPSTARYTNQCHIN